MKQFECKTGRTNSTNKQGEERFRKVPSKPFKTQARGALCKQTEAEQNKQNGKKRIRNKELTRNSSRGDGVEDDRLKDSALVRAATRTTHPAKPSRPRSKYNSRKIAPSDQPEQVQISSSKSQALEIKSEKKKNYS